MPKLRVGLLFGGRSTEHEVSIESARSILTALDPERYELRLIGVDREGRWHLGAGSLSLEDSIEGREVTLPAVPCGGKLLPSPEQDAAAPIAIDVVFPIVHGRGGEDGSLQGLLELANIPYVGSGVLSSALQMDKEVAKRLLREAGLPVVPWQRVSGPALSASRLEESARRAEAELGLPVFVKPANSGSSVGTTRAATLKELANALAEAARYDTKVLVERAVDAREIEVAVLGNETPEASVPGEICVTHTFYDYEAKYAGDEGTELLIPAPLDAAQAQRVRDLALDAYRCLGAEGFARVDFFLDRCSGEFFVNELNSLPGFTEGSMVPRLWEASGLAYPALIDRLIELALERFETRSRLETRLRLG